MVDPTTTNLKLATPIHGSDTDTWDQPLNANAGILDTCFGSVTTKSVSNITITLSATESQAAILRFTGTLTGNIAVNLGDIVKTWTIENLTTGNFFIRLQGFPGTGNFVGLPPGSCQVYWDGTNLSYVNLDKIGAYWDYAGAALPVWVQACTIPPYLYCDGSAFSGVTYPLLAQILGGTTLPDARGRTRIALNAGTNRVTVAAVGIDGDARFSAGGLQDITLVSAQLPLTTVTGTINDTRTWGLGYTNSGTSTGGGPFSFTFSNVAVDTSVKAVSVQSGSITFNGGAFGANVAHNNMQPTYVGGIVMIRAA